MSKTKLSPSRSALLPLPKMTPKRLGALHKLGIQTLDDCLFHFPLRHEDRATVRLISESVGHTVRIRVTIDEVSLTRKKQAELAVFCSDESGALALRFLKVFPGQYQRFTALRDQGEPVDVYGEIRRTQRGLEMYHPKLLTARTTEQSEGLSPVYPICQGISQDFLATLIQKALTQCEVKDTLPEDLRIGAGLIEWSDALHLLHHKPTSSSDLGPAWQRIRFDELLAQQLRLREARRQAQQDVSPMLSPKAALMDRFLKVLPFELTQAQRRAWEDISTDIARKTPMRRLLQGDVGSGKTVVAALSVVQCVANGFQAVLMAPTDILATQHAQTLSKWLSAVGIRVALLTSSIDAPTVRALLAATETGEIDCLIGTHALFYDRIQFKQLGLAIIDEQHRFGVEQRYRLAQKGQAPHQLLMTATPIPRSLAMTYLADADLSIIDQLPPGRQPVKTKLIDSSRRSALIDSIYKACQMGQRVYWVCPLIEESEVLSLQTIEQTRSVIAQQYPDLRLGILTGRLKSQEKQEIMESFKAGNCDILIATTVIEVGVDVPEANIIVIEEADRFGLAQLHQLRGRVGRGKEAAVCVLLYEKPLSLTAKERLKILYETTDGFEVAKRDMQLRGIGDYYGIRQSGLPILRFADPIRDAHLIDLAADMAEKMLDRYSQAASHHLHRYRYKQNDTLKF